MPNEPILLECLKFAIKRHIEKGNTLRDLEQLSGVSKATLSNINTGKSGVTLENFEKLCHALNLKIEVKCVNH